MIEFDPYHRWLGIPPEEQPPHHYRLLGIKLFEDQPEVIEHAADRQMAHLRTFQVGPHAALSQRLLNEVAAAKLCLLKPDKKAAYDRFLRARLAAAKQPALPAGEPPPFPAAPPDEETAVVELDSSDEEKIPTRFRRQRWKAVAAGIVAIALIVGILTLVSMLRVTTSSPLAENSSRLPPAPQAVSSSPNASPGSLLADGPTASNLDTSSGGTQPTALDSDDADEEAAWAWIFENDWEDLSSPAETLTDPKNPIVPSDTRASVPKGRPDPKPMHAPTDSSPPPAGKSDAQPGPEPPPKPESKPEPPPKRPDWKPEPFKIVAQVDPLLAEAWTLIHRGEYIKGREKLAEAGKTHRDDLRVPFSLGLVDALLTLDWASAEKEFLQCVQEHPKHVASLNNLALVRLRLGRESQAVKHWQTALAEGPAPKEIVQNLGRIRFLAQKGRITLKPVTFKAISSLFVDAESSGDGVFDDQSGFWYIGLYGGGDPRVGWTDRHDYEDRWCPVCNARGAIPCPQRDCDHGMVTRMASKVVGFHPITKVPIRQESPIRVPCPICNQTGTIPCPYCTNGKDKLLK